MSKISVMTEVKLKYCGLVIGVFCSAMLLAQPHNIRGTVIDEQSGEPVSFAHIYLGEYTTVTNSSGAFVLSFDKIPDDELSVSHLGYHPSKIGFDPSKEEYQIRLDQFEVILEEASEEAGESIMHKVFSRFPLNYEQRPKTLLSYYKEKLTSNNELCYLAEGILDIYLPSSVSKEPAKVSPIKTRKKVAHKDVEHEITLIRGHASDMAKSSVWRSDSFLEVSAFLKKTGNYAFKYTGKKLHGDGDVYIVEFHPKNTKGYVSGVLYIEDKTFAIRKMEYYPSTERNGFWNQVKWTEEFERQNGVYYMVSSTFEGKWKEGQKEFVFRAVLANNDISLADSYPATIDYLDEKDMFFHAASDDFSDSFWENYNFIKLDDMERSF